MPYRSNSSRRSASTTSAAHSTSTVKHKVLGSRSPGQRNSSVLMAAIYSPNYLQSFRTPKPGDYPLLAQKATERGPCRVVFVGRLDCAINVIWLRSSIQAATICGLCVLCLPQRNVAARKGG